MKTTNRILFTTLVAALALPVAAFAAKANKKNAAEPLPAFATLNKDGDGSISEAEFVAALKDKPAGEQGAKTQFATLDKDHDGKLTKEELAAATPEKKKRKKKDAN